MSSLTFEPAGTRVVFGAGALSQLPDEIASLGASRILIVATPGRASLSRRVQSLLGDSVAAVFGDAAVHVPAEVAEKAHDAAVASRADLVLALGGGSAIGVAKAIAFRTSLSIVAVPTTYGGSEMTPIWGETKVGRKQTGRDERVRPKLVIYDPDLTLSLSGRTTACSGLNAVAHCVEALYAVDANAVTTEAATEALRLLGDSLPLLAESPGDRPQRERALRGAWLAGYALGTVQMALHHKLCHTLGGSFDLGHADTHAVLIPYTAAYNRDAAPDAMRLAAAALGVEDAPAGILNLARSTPAPVSLEQIGMQRVDLERAAELAVEQPYPNPRPVERDAILELLTAAFHGDAGYVSTV